MLGGAQEPDDLPPDLVIRELEGVLGVPGHGRKVLPVTVKHPGDPEGVVPAKPGSCDLKARLHNNSRKEGSETDFQIYFVGASLPLLDF